MRYDDTSGDAGVTHYKIAPDAIHVKFRDGSIYVYDELHPGRDHVARMKSLARYGRGLATYISHTVRDNYARRLGG